MGVAARSPLSHGGAMSTSDLGPLAGFTRRRFLIGGATITVVGCGAPLPDLDGGRGNDAGTGADGGRTGANEPPVWAPIPDQSWVVGVPVHFDLRGFCSDPDGDALTFVLTGTLPAGLTLLDGVIMGTPTEVTASASVTATADDGRV